MKQVLMDNTPFYQIEYFDKMRPFFMTILSSSNHWMFISSNGGLTTGRTSSDFSLFPYYTEDKITDAHEHTGPKTILKGHDRLDGWIWEPFSEKKQSHFDIKRNLYKSIYGNQIVFEEVNKTLGLVFKYQWSNSEEYGFIRTSTIHNIGDIDHKIEVLDGLQNVLPAGVGSDLQNHYSNLVDAYKQTELIENGRLGIYALSAIIVDRAEPSEALKANIIWAYGLENAQVLLSNFQLQSFRNGLEIQPEIENKGEKGAFFLVDTVEVKKNKTATWYIVADVNKSHAQVVTLCEKLENPMQLMVEVQKDVDQGTSNLIQLAAAADGLQMTSDTLKDTRHFSNVMFNIMRGGVFEDHYQVQKSDFISYLKKANIKIYNESLVELSSLPDKFPSQLLEKLPATKQKIDFKRLCREYLPLYFSRRHGDPSRPWNKFFVNTKNELSGAKTLDYQGNWRDIFQNWEALGRSFPDFVEGMVYKFLNASTFEGYNPYRISKDGFDWEVIEPDDPWAYIGYWGDHQVIYLLKFLEFLEQYQPESLKNLLDKEEFVYANVPYKIKKYTDILQNPKDTITFDHKLDVQIKEEKSRIGADACLLYNESHQIHHVNFFEKVLAVVLSKISNFIPEAGIWMNTQRPEWNDANNALVGNGVSMVTLCYLRRFLAFFQEIIHKTELSEIKISQELVDYYKNTRNILEENVSLLASKIKDSDRKIIVDQLGEVASSYRWHIYQHGFWGKKRSISLDGIKKFINLSLQYVDHSIRANERQDGLYHAYNIMSVEGESVSISRLPVMLEGQVAALSAGILSGKQAVQLLVALKNSPLYVTNRNSYLLYPNKRLPSFIEKNTFGEDKLKEMNFLQELLEKKNCDIIEKDIKGKYHFNKNFKNIYDLKTALSEAEFASYIHYSNSELEKVYALYEKIFNHKSFMGRSGTFYAFEGLGSIYWHMVSKLLLAVNENILKAHQEGEDETLILALVERYYDIYEGIGTHKKPQDYGAFPTDAYSHTPMRRGAQQPGMTGQVKEDIICRWGELGIGINHGQLSFSPKFLKHKEFKGEPFVFSYYDLDNKFNTLEVKPNSLVFTYCQIPIVYQVGDENKILVSMAAGESHTFEGNELPLSLSKAIFLREKKIKYIRVIVKSEQLI